MPGQSNGLVNGNVLDFINAAKTMIGKPYVWGGTTANGVDCSGLLYYAFNKAGIQMPRYRASDYGQMGEQVEAKAAQPGDIVYWSDGGGHVGIYLGNGMVLNSPHSGMTTQIDKVWGNPVYRRLVNDSAFGHVATPDGDTTLGYQGLPVSTVFTNGVQNNLNGIQWNDYAPHDIGRDKPI